MSFRNEVLRYLGYRGQNISDELSKQIDKNIEMIEKNIKPKSIFRIFDISEEFYLDETNLKLLGNDIKNHLKNAKKCALLAVTLGMECERILNTLLKTNISDALICDAICTAKVEEVADLCEVKIKEYAKENNMYTNFRYSPGYGDFPLQQQESIGAVLNCEKTIGLTVTENSLLIPQKSVTAVVGLFVAEQKNEKKNCSICNLKDRCKFKMSGTDCEGGRK